MLVCLCSVYFPMVWNGFVPPNISMVCHRHDYAMCFTYQEEDRLKRLMENLQIERGGGLTSDDVRRWPVAQRFANLARELAAVSERLTEKEEEIGELKSERSNTRVSLVNGRHSTYVCTRISVIIHSNTSESKHC